MGIIIKLNGQLSRTTKTFTEPTYSSYCLDLLSTFLGIEVWRQVRDFPDYNVSNFGDVQHFRDGITRNKYFTSSGYHIVSLAIKNEQIHTIVCKTFIPESVYVDKNLTIDHKNRDRTYNILTNLKWATREEQRKNQSYPETHSKTRPILRCDLDGNKLEQYTGSHQAAGDIFSKTKHKYTTVASLAANITNCCSGSRKSDILNGYKWCFDEEVNASLPGEIWKDIPVTVLGDPKHEYEASTEGRIRTNRNNRIMNGSILEGYRRYSIAQNGNTHTRLTVRGNRVIAATFLPNPCNLPVVDHKNELRHDDRVENLRWVTYKQNTDYHHQINGTSWSEEHEQLLMDACKEVIIGDNVIWNNLIIPTEISHKPLTAIKGRYFEIIKRDPSYNRGQNLWTDKEDQVLKEACEEAIVKEVKWDKFTKPGILEYRTMGAIQSRYRKHLNNEVLRYPGRYKKSWTHEEDQALMEACKKAYVDYIEWTKFITPEQLKQRTNCAIKGRWEIIRKSLTDCPKRRKSP
jgi:hypothetical protein